MREIFKLTSPSKSAPPTADFLDSIVNAAPTSTSREKLREILNKRLLPFATADVTDRNKKAWLACSTKAQSDEELARKRATYLSSLVCRASVDQKYVSSGIYRNVVAKSPIFLFQSLETGHFARSLILASGKFCPGADELDEKIKERLREIASTGPAK